MANAKSMAPTASADEPGALPRDPIQNATFSHPDNDAAVDTIPHAPNAIIFFDGVCGLCNRFIDFVIRKDRDERFHFAPLQGETARRLLPASDVDDLNSVVLWDASGVSRKSTAAVQILSQLHGPWGWLGTVLRIVPRPLRDIGYSVVAKYRYAVFGKKSVCRMPTAAERARFLP